MAKKITRNVKLYEYDLVLAHKENFSTKHVAYKSFEILLESKIKKIVHRAYPEYSYVSCSYIVSNHSYSVPIKDFVDLAVKLEGVNNGS